MLSRDPADLTQKYYQDFRRRHGFADSELRGHGHGIIVPPIGNYTDDTSAATKFVSAEEMERGRPGTSRDHAIEKTKRVRQRADKADELLNDLRRLVAQLRNRIESRPTTAVRDVYTDALAVIAGQEPLARGSRVVVLEGLVSILRRYA